jgi:hypothetical protein
MPESAAVMAKEPHFPCPAVVSPFSAAFIMTHLRPRCNIISAPAAADHDRNRTFRDA